MSFLCLIRRFALFVPLIWIALLAAKQLRAQSKGEPFPFSHKRHASLNFQCVSCHEKALAGDKAGFPIAEKCMVCHVTVSKDAEPIKHLAALPKDAPIIPEKPVYVLPDFVNFSHAKHKTDSITCNNCHGDVWTSDVIEAQLKMRMKACVDCHKANQAPVTCTTCHENFR